MKPQNKHSSPEKPLRPPEGFFGWCSFVMSTEPGGVESDYNAYLSGNASRFPHTSETLADDVTFQAQKPVANFTGVDRKGCDDKDQVSPSPDSSGHQAEPKSRKRPAPGDNWLPSGWRVEVKFRTSGSRARVEKCYYQPITGRKFRSMSNVLYYLEHEWNTDSPVNHMEFQRSNRSSRKAEEPTPPATLPPPPLNLEKVSPSPDSSGHQAESKSRKRPAPGDNWLPSGCRVDKVRTSGSSAGRVGFLTSRRRSNRVRNSRHVTSSAPVTIIDDCEEDEFLDHRTCWKHIAALNKRCSKQELEIFKLSAPCFYDECTRRGRSKRRIKCKYLVPMIRKKLNSRAFVGYLEDVWRGISDEKKNSFVYLDCLWFSMYKSEISNYRSYVFHCIKEKQIFSKKYVFLPIVYWNHWTLLIFCNFGEDLNSNNTCMVFLDSLQTTDSRQRVEPDIRKFVLDIYRTEGRTEDPRLVDEIPLHAPVVPQQTNDVECGSFVLYYIQRFIEDAPEDFIVDAYPYFMKKDWFSHKELEEFCDKLDSLGTIH